MIDPATLLAQLGEVGGALISKYPSIAGHYIQIGAALLAKDPRKANLHLAEALALSNKAAVREGVNQAIRRAPPPLPKKTPGTGV